MIKVAIRQMLEKSFPSKFKINSMIHVPNHQFLKITLSDAIHMLRSNMCLILVVRGVGTYTVGKNKNIGFT